jgi:hypothetical protein
MKNIGPCRIFRNFVANASEIKLLENVGILPIFNVVDLYPYIMDDTGESNDQKEIQWEKHIPTRENPHMEKILDQMICKKTRRKTYFEYLVKWKDHPTEDASWVTEPDIQRHGKKI